MSIHDICFYGEIRKIFLDTPLIDRDQLISTWKRAEISS